MGGLIVRVVTSSIVCELCERCLNFTLPTALAITTITTIPDYTTSTILYHTNETHHPLASPPPLRNPSEVLPLYSPFILPQTTSHHILLLFPLHTSKLTYGKHRGVSRSREGIPATNLGNMQFCLVENPTGCICMGKIAGCVHRVQSSLSGVTRNKEPIQRRRRREAVKQTYRVTFNLHCRR